MLFELKISGGQPLSESCVCFAHVLTHAVVFTEFHRAPHRSYVVTLSG